VAAINESNARSDARPIALEEIAEGAAEQCAFVVHKIATNMNQHTSNRESCFLSQRLDG
jgi:hypothetical protein